jgi:heat shock protein HtpX
MARRSLYGLIAVNRWKTAFFVILFTIIIAIIGVAIVFVFTETWNGFLVWCVLLAVFLIGYNIIFFFASKSLALAANGARKADPRQYKRLHNVVEEMAIASGQPKPGVYIVADPSPNAFATGRNPKNAAIAVTTGLYEMLDRAELQGVIAHEMSHIKNHDILLMTIVAIMVGAVVLARDIMLRWGLFFGRGRSRSSGKGSGYTALIRLAIVLILLVLASIAVLLIRAAISRQREYMADASGAMMTRNPEGLARALEKIGAAYKPIQRKTTATAHLYISSPACKDRINPKKPHQKVKVNLWSTHPPIGMRVERLRSLNLAGDYARQFTWARSESAGTAGLAVGGGSVTSVTSVTGVTGMGLVDGNESESAPQSSSVTHPEPTPQSSPVTQSEPDDHLESGQKSKDNWVDEYFKDNE